MSSVIKLKSRARLSLGQSDVEVEMPSAPQIQQRELEQRRHEQELQENLQIGFQRGYEEAWAELEQNFDAALLQKTEEFYAILSSFEEKLHSYETAFDELVLQLSLKIAEKVVHREVTLNSTIETVLRESIKKVMGSNEIHIKINPEDYQLLYNEGKTAFIEKSFNKVKFEATERIERGGCIIETEIGNVDARISSQMQSITNELQASLSSNA